MGEIGVLNVGAGDTKIVFDKNNPAELERAKRIVTDMLKRGYALLIETGAKDAQGRPIMARALEFDPDTCEYIIADFDSARAEEHDRHEQVAPEADAQAGAPAPRKARGPKRTQRIPAASARGVAVARTAGG